MVSNEPPQQRRGSATPRLERIVEALLFLAPEPVSTAELAEACEVTEAEIDRALDLLGESLAGRGLVLREVAGGGLALDTWMVDHDGRGVAGPARELAYLDAQGGRPQQFAGRRADRNARLYLP